MTETIARRTGRLLASSRKLIMSGEQKGLNLNDALRRILLAYDPSATYTEGLFDASKGRMMGESIVMLYRDGSRLRVGNDLEPQIVSTGEPSDE